MFATGFDGHILHYDGSVWSPMGDSGTSEELWGIWGSSPVDVYVSETGGAILHYDGQRLVANGQRHAAVGELAVGCIAQRHLCRGR